MRRLEGRSSHLYDRDGKFVFRRSVPPELRKELGRREWKKAIGSMARMPVWEAERAADILTKQTTSEIQIARRRCSVVDERQQTLGYETALQMDAMARAARREGGITKLNSKYSTPLEVVREHGSANERSVLLGEKPLSSVYEYVREQHPVSAEKHRDLAVQHFIELSGDLDVKTIIRRDVLEFVTQYKKRGLAPGTLRRRLGALTSVVNHYYRDHDIQRTNPFHGSVKAAGPAHSADDRLPLREEQVRDLCDYLRTNNRISPFTRAVFWLIITTGAGPAEAGGLVAEDVVLDHDIPHVWIRANDVRGLKTASRERRLPLVGDALIHAPALLERKCKPVSVGATLGKQLKLAITLDERQSVYSLRHSMADRLRANGASDAQARYVLGHSRASAHERYGARHLELLTLREVLLSTSILDLQERHQSFGV